MSHLGFEINDELRLKLKIHLAMNNLSVKEYLTKLIEKDLEENAAKENRVPN